MAQAKHRGSSFPTAWRGRLGVGRALLAAFLIVMGFSAGVATAARPAAEYCSRPVSATEGLSLQSPVAVWVRQASVGHRCGPIAVAFDAAVQTSNSDRSIEAAGQADYGFTAASDPQGEICRPDEATGPPAHD